MKMRNYMKKKQEQVDMEAIAEETITSAACAITGICGKRLLVGGLVLFAGVLTVCGYFAHKSINNVSISEEALVQLSAAPIAATSGNTGVITIPTGTVKANPFLPYRDIDGNTSKLDVPAYNLVEPPEVINENSDAARVMDTIVSGILYDKYSPSAILNIEGNDYLVKKGDVVNNYKVISIMQDSVTVKLGSNTYKAGIGEILTEGSLNHNDVSNLNNKFGGERR